MVNRRSRVALRSNVFIFLFDFGFFSSPLIKLAWESNQHFELVDNLYCTNYDKYHIQYARRSFERE